MDGDGGNDQRCGEKKGIVYLLDGGGWYLLTHKVGGDCQDRFFPIGN